MNKKNFQHTQKTVTSITSVVFLGQELVQMLYITQPLSSLPLHLSGGGDIPTYRKEYNNDASSGDGTSELILEKGDDNELGASRLVVVFYT